MGCKCSFKPTNLFFHTPNAVSRGGRLTSGYDIGINFPKGIFLHFFSPELYISKDGVAEMITTGYGNSCSYGCVKSIPVRLVALLEAMLFVISLPFQLIAYVLFLLAGLFAGLVLLPTCCCEFKLCCSGNFLGNVATNRNMCRLGWIYFICSIIAIAYLIAYIVLIPFQIISPEFCVYVLKYHRWNTTPFACFS